MKKLLIVAIVMMLAPFSYSQETNEKSKFNPEESGYQVFRYIGKSADEALVVVNNSSTEDAFKIVLLCINKHTGTEEWVEMCTTPTLITKEMRKNSHKGKYKYESKYDMPQMNAKFTDNIHSIAIKSKSGKKYSLSAKRAHSDLCIDISDFQEDSMNNEDW